VHCLFFLKYILVNKKRKGVQLKYIGSILEQPQLEEGEEKKIEKLELLRVATSHQR
jgi:hypothetical protein